jgi:hypothetical protein
VDPIKFRILDLTGILLRVLSTKIAELPSVTSSRSHKEFGFFFIVMGERKVIPDA